MILWIKYNKIISTVQAISKSKQLSEWLQPGYYELYEMGNNNKYIITSDDGYENNIGTFWTTDNKQQLKWYLSNFNIKIGQRIGFSHRADDISDIWVGYKIISNSNQKYPVVVTQIAMGEGTAEFYRYDNGIGFIDDIVTGYNEGGYCHMSFDAHEMYEFLKSIYEPKRNMNDEI